MIEFGHPYPTTTLTVSLRNPELGNSVLTENRVQVRQDMSGNLHSFRRTPASIHLLLTFTELSKPKVQELINFIVASAGDEIKYTDFDAIVWRGYIMNPAEFTTIGRKGGTCIEVSTITIEFRGSQV